MSEHRTHPVTLLQMIWRFLFLLIFPAARGFLTALSGGNVAEWLDGAWKDILIIAAILLLAFLQWWCLRYRWESVGLSIRRGVLFRQRMFIPAAKIITMSLTRPFYLKPVGGVRLRVDTWAGAGNSTDISLILPKKAAESIFSKRENALSDLDFAPREYHPKGLYVTCLAAILSSSFAGVLFFATFISQTGSLLGQEFADRITGTFERLTRAIAWGIPPATVAVAYLIIFGWLYSFIRNLIRHKNFVVRRRKNELYIDSGIITNRSYSIRLDEINYIDIRQSLVTKLLGLHSVFVNAVGYGKEKDDISAMIPANPWERLQRHLHFLLPEFAASPRQVKPNGGAIFPCPFRWQVRCWQCCFPAGQISLILLSGWRWSPACGFWPCGFWTFSPPASAVRAICSRCAIPAAVSCILLFCPGSESPKSFCAKAQSKPLTAGATCSYTPCRKKRRGIISETWISRRSWRSLTATKPALSPLPAIKSR